jgi:hypothetical protein
LVGTAAWVTANIAIRKQATAFCNQNTSAAKNENAQKRKKRRKENYSFNGINWKRLRNQENSRKYAN